MRVFLDTNVLVSAFATRGICADILTVILSGHELVLGATVMAEFERVARTKLHMPRALVTEATDFLRTQATVVTGSGVPDVRVRDPDDLPVLADALAGRADVLVTGARDLLELEDQAGVPIVSPRGFWEMLHGER